MFGLSFSTIVILVIVGILLYGDQLPEVAKSFGKSLVEVKKGLNHLQSEFHSVINEEPKRKPAANYHPIDDGEQPIAPKFEPPPAEPRSVDPRA